MTEFFQIEAILFGQVVRQPAIPPVVTSGRWYYLGLAMLVLALIAAGTTAYRLWFDLNDVEDPDKPEDLLEAFKMARAAGEIDDQEFEKVRRQLGGTLSSEPKPSRRDLSPPA